MKKTIISIIIICLILALSIFYITKNDRTFPIINYSSFDTLLKSFKDYQLDISYNSKTQSYDIVDENVIIGQITSYPSQINISFWITNPEINLNSINIQIRTVDSKHSLLTYQCLGSIFHAYFFHNLTQEIQNANIKIYNLIQKLFPDFIPSYLEIYKHTSSFSNQDTLDLDHKKYEYGDGYMKIFQYIPTPKFLHL